MPLPTGSRHDGFWSKVFKTDCSWLWTRSKSGTMGYGAFWQAGRIVRAHRVAYEACVGPIPDGLDIMHVCDVPLCVRPDHLRPGTRAENQQDMAAKGRNGPQDGEYNHHAKFNWDQIHELRERARQGERQLDLAVAFATSRRYVSKVITEAVWPEAKCPIHGTVAAERAA